MGWAIRFTIAEIAGYLTPVKFRQKTNLVDAKLLMN